MSPKRYPLRLSLGLILVLLCNVLPVAAQTPAGSHYVRVPATAMRALNALGLSPQLALDYGSFTWLELTAADYDRLARSRVPHTPVPDAGQVRVPGYRFDPVAEGAPALPAIGEGPALRMVQFVGPVRERWLTAVQEAGGRALQYYPHNTYLVWADRPALNRLASQDFVRWMGDFHAAYKVNADLRGRTGVIRNIAVMFYDDGDRAATLAAIADLGGKIIQSYPAQPDRAFYEAIVELDAVALEAVAALDAVLWLGYASPEPAFDDEMSDQILAGNHPGGVPVTGYGAHLAGLSYDGAGVTWAIIDTGVDYDHPDLGPHIVGGYNFPGACTISGQPGTDCSSAYGGGHGTHVSGIVGGTAAAGYTDANGFLYGLGVAPAVSFFAMNSLSGPDWPPAGGWQEHSKRAVLGSAIGGNNSWTTGEGTDHGYQSSERTHDLMVRDGNFDTTDVAEPFIEVFSAGNSGSSSYTLTAPKEAKNLIVTASSLNYRAGNIDLISSFSSRGPAADGRWVPTITAPGEDIASTANDLGGDCSTGITGTNDMYALCSGTSMAAPHTSGAVALLADWWADTHGGATLSPALAKALLVNSAVDLGTADIPNISEGWGRINITQALAPGVPVLYFDQEDIFGAAGEQWILNISVADPGQPLKISLAWTDAAGAVGANPALVNDLNLTVTTGGNTYKGNVFSAGWSTMGGVADALNNLENVFIQAPGSDLGIVVDAANLPGDGIPYNADATDQDFALVCYNCLAGPDFALDATPTSQAVCAPADASFDVAVAPLGGFSEAVTLSAAAPAGASIGFSVNPITPPGSSTLTIGNTAAAVAGVYPIDITGSSASKTHTVGVALTIAHAPPVAPVLLAPVADAIGQSLKPTFTWSAVSGVASYEIAIATDPAFAVVVHSATVPGASYTPTTPLVADTQYYWRVGVSNACGPTVSAAARFHTEASACTLFASANVPKDIPRNGSVTSNLTIGGSSVIQDLNVVGLKGQHASFGDLSFSLRSPAATDVQIMADTCSSGADFDLNLDDEAAVGAWPCPPTGGGTYRPSNPLSVYDGQTANGAWTLTVTDNVFRNGGTLDGWGLEVCTLTCNAATAANGLGISALDASTVRLGWVEAGAATYEVWYAANAPYFDLTGLTCAAPGAYDCAITSALDYDHTGLGSVASSYTYVVRSANACGDVTAQPSNRVGEFEFALVAGGE